MPANPSLLLVLPLPLVLVLVLPPLTLADPPSPSPTPSPNLALVTAARARIGVTTIYDGSYVSISYPNGDVPSERGVCTDVVVRAFRKAFAKDLQKLLHEDMKRHFSAYPQNWGARGPDKNIDHRRVPNLRAWFKRQGWSLPVTDKPADYQPGDLVTCIVPPHLPHIMIVSDKKSATGVPFVIHNIGRGTQEEDRLFEFELTGHYRPPLAWASSP